jgi:hypothetical protein
LFVIVDMAQRLLNFVAFYLGWFACVLGAADGAPLIGPAVVAALLALHLWLSHTPTREARLILVVGILGWFIDTSQAVAGVFSFGTHALPTWLCPPWLVAMWMIFASTLSSSMGWLVGRYGLAAVLGAGTGPLSYYYGVRLGAIDVHAHLVVSLLCLGLVWAITMPILIHLAARLTPQSATPPAG